MNAQRQTNKQKRQSHTRVRDDMHHQYTYSFVTHLSHNVGIFMPHQRTVTSIFQTIDQALNDLFLLLILIYYLAIAVVVVVVVRISLLQKIRGSHSHSNGIGRVSNGILEFA